MFALLIGGGGGGGKDCGGRERERAMLDNVGLSTALLMGQGGAYVV